MSDDRSSVHDTLFFTTESLNTKREMILDFLLFLSLLSSVRKNFHKRSSHFLKVAQGDLAQLGLGVGYGAGYGFGASGAQGAAASGVFAQGASSGFKNAAGQSAVVDQNLDYSRIATTNNEACT